MTMRGRGCNMCVTPRHDGLFETLNDNNLNWLEHYDDKKCMHQSLYPTMEFVPTNENLDKPITNPSKNNIDPTKYFKPSIQKPFSYDTIAGVYTLYPYIRIPNQVPKDMINDDNTQDNYNRLLSLQLKYYTNPDYHIKVEITGISKASYTFIFLKKFKLIFLLSGTRQ